MTIALAVGTWFVLKPGSEVAAHPPAPPATIYYELVAGDVALVETHALSITEPLSGSLTPMQEATIRSKASGQISVTAMQEGQTVRLGDVLARLDAAEPKARLAQQQALLEQAQAKLALAIKNQDNSQALLDQRYISQNAYDTTRNTVELVQADVKSMQAQVELARIAVDDMVIRAPIAGIVSKRFVQAGDKLAPDLAVCTIVNLEQMVMQAQVPATDIASIKIGQDVGFTVDGLNDRQFAGKVARINPAAEGGSRAMMIYVNVPNADGALRSGMFATGSAVTGRSAPGSVVPLNAVRTVNGATAVYRIDHDEVVLQKVKLGMRNDTEGYAQVTSGLASGALVIVSRLDGLKPGSKVKIIAPAQG